MLPPATPSTMLPRAPSFWRCGLMISRRRAMGRTEPSLTNLNYNVPRPQRRRFPGVYGTASHFHGSVREPGQALPGRAGQLCGHGATPDVILQFEGGPAHSDFRLAKLLSRLRVAVPSVRTVASRFVHLADCARPPEEASRARLAALLTYGPRH